MRASTLSQQKQQTIDDFERFLTRGAEPQWPLEVFLEISNVCNLTCAMCGPFSALNEDRLLALAEQERGFLDIDALEPALEPLLQHALLVHAFGYGEPTVHPRFLDLLERLSAHEVMLDFITNGQRLTEALSERLVDLQIATVTVSASGDTREAYESIYLGGDFDRLLRGLSSLASEKARRSSRYPIVTVNSIGFRHHVETLPAFVDLMADHGVNVIELKKLMNDVPMLDGHAAPYRPDVEGRLLDEARRRADIRGVLLSVEQFTRESADTSPDPVVPLTALRSKARRFGHQLSAPPSPVAQASPSTRDDLELAFDMAPLNSGHFGPQGAFHCPEPFKTFYVRQSGLVKPCCFAPDSAPPLGDLRRETGLETWTGRPYRFIRAGIASTRYSRSACEPCLSRGSGPKNWVARERIHDFAAWYATRFGHQLTTADPRDMPDPRSICASAAGRATDSGGEPPRVDGTATEVAAGLRVRLSANPWLGATGDTSSSPIDLVVPIHNARHHLERCLDAVARHTDHPFRLILINDGSTDPDVSPLLTTLRGAPGVVVLDRAENLGFVHTANEGLAFSGTRDVVLLNSDTVVSQGWLSGLSRVAHTRPDVATVTPLTNNGTLCSVPLPFHRNHIPSGYDVDTFSALVAATSLRLYPEVPTGVGFCLFITRRSLRSTGLFDAATFGRGYGEENDFCQRAIAAGFVNLIADDVFVYHEGGASFGADTDPLLAEHLDALRKRHPHYDDAVSAVVREHPLREFHAYLSASIDAGRTAADVTGSLRVLHVLHQGGGTEKHARELAQIPDRSLWNFVSTSDGQTLFVDEYVGGLILRRMMLPLHERIDAEDPRPSTSYRTALRSACAALGIQIVHVHHLRNNTVDVVDVARELGIPLVLTIHDYHLVCPSYTLLGPAGEPCGACLTPDVDASRIDRCLACRGRTRHFLDEYQGAMTRVLDAAAHIVVPSMAAKRIVSRRYPQVERASVIEHGHRIDVLPGRSRAGRHDDELRIAVLGGLDVHKGRDVLRRVLRENSSRVLVWHLYGTTSDQELSSAPRGRETLIDGSRVVNHGPYVPSEIVALLQTDGIDVGLHLSIWPETFSFTLSEFAAAGVPVIAWRLGAQGDRTEAHALGWTVPDIGDVAQLLTRLAALAASPARLAEARNGMRSREALRSLPSMWDDYASLYRKTWGRQMPVDGSPTSPEMSGYLVSVAARLAGEYDAHQRTRGDLQRALDEIHRLEELLRSPRHRVATLAATVLQRIPVVWPVVARVTDALIARRRTGATTQPSKPAHRHE